MKIRIEGTQKEVEQLICGNELGDCIRLKGFNRITSQSKFYPNQNTAGRMLNRVSENGRVYLEVE